VKNTINPNIKYMLAEVNAPLNITNTLRETVSDWSKV